MSYSRNLARISRTGAPTVDSAQALRDLTIYNGLQPSVVLTLGAKLADDGGGGVWRWDADSIADDDLATVLLPTGHVGPGRRVRVWDGKLVNLLWYGLPRNQTDDDAAVITAAIAASPYVDFRLPAGSYWFHTTLLVERTNVSLIGDGEFSTWIYRVADGYDLIHYFTPLDKLIPNKHYTISGLCLWSEIDGLLNTSGASLHIEWGSRANIRDIQSRGGYENFVFEALSNSHVSRLHTFTNANFGGVLAPGSSQLRFSSIERNNDLKNCAALTVNGVIANLSLGNVGGLLERNVVINGSDGIWFSQCHFGWADKGCMLILPEIFPSGKQSNVIGLIFNAVHFDGQDYEVDYSVEYQQPAGYTGSIKGHTYTGCQATACRLAGYKFPLDPDNNIQNMMWAGGKVQNSTGWGFDVEGGTSFVITGMHLSDCDLGGMRMRNSRYFNVAATFQNCTVGLSVDKNSDSSKFDCVWQECDTDVVIENINGANERVSISGTTTTNYIVESAATIAVPLPQTFFRVTGAVPITAVDSSEVFLGREITLFFPTGGTVVDSGSLRLAGDFVAGAWSSLSLLWAGTGYWQEKSRSINS